MLSVPIPIVVSIVLITLMLMHREQLSSMPSGRWFLGLLVIYVISLVLIGLRWAIPAPQLMRVLPIVAVVWCVVAWLAFRSLSRDGPVLLRSDWPHLVPLVAIVIALVAAPIWIEAVIIVCNLFYAALLVRLALRGADRLRLVKFTATQTSLFALWITAALLVASAVIEFVIWLDFALYRGSHAARIVAWVNVPILLFMGVAATTAGQAVTESADEPSPQPVDTPEQTDMAALLVQLEELLVGQQLYTDADLNLQRLARKAGVPARQVSRAVNSQTQLNVSQWVNAARIRAACDLLRDTDTPVTEIMHQVGFVTKSNFNREFRRATSQSPSEWRKQAVDMDT